ncbi:MAG: hypothetical protein P1U47_05260 [Zhongshania sp.]|uniref:hypothetical protein n=1 Tax=Zhongshania sp. TaxID=1971902 RepID=UPI00261E2F01|nr:hypothetical protein [Zhongshania sp.]MDF1691756.1 hypothetical protein [Zhongshania sp.]
MLKLTLLCILILLILAGCAAQQPDVLPVPIYCQVPAGLLVQSVMPATPTGNYTQRDVADYINQLYYYAVSGWDRVQAVDTWVAQHCE